jgi:hypothetical protein
LSFLCNLARSPAASQRDALGVAVNAAVKRQTPLLARGDRATGQTEPARQVTAAFNLPLIAPHVKSTRPAPQGRHDPDPVSHPG